MKDDGSIRVYQSFTKILHKWLIIVGHIYTSLLCMLNAFNDLYYAWIIGGYLHFTADILAYCEACPSNYSTHA